MASIIDILEQAKEWKERYEAAEQAYRDLKAAYEKLKDAYDNRQDPARALDALEAALEAAGLRGGAGCAPAASSTAGRPGPPPSGRRPWR